jgi:hypothetical protein
MELILTERSDGSYGATASTMGGGKSGGSAIELLCWSGYFMIEALVDVMPKRIRLAWKRSFFLAPLPDLLVRGQKPMGVLF